MFVSSAILKTFSVPAIIIQIIQIGMSRHYVCWHVYCYPKSSFILVGLNGSAAVNAVV